MVINKTITIKIFVGAQIQKIKRINKWEIQNLLMNFRKKLIHLKNLMIINSEVISLIQTIKFIKK